MIVDGFFKISSARANHRQNEKECNKRRAHAEHQRFVSIFGIAHTNKTTTIVFSHVISIACSFRIRWQIISVVLIFRWRFGFHFNCLTGVHSQRIWFYGYSSVLRKRQKRKTNWYLDMFDAHDFWKNASFRIARLNRGVTLMNAQWNNEDSIEAEIPKSKHNNSGTLKLLFASNFWITVHRTLHLNSLNDHEKKSEQRTNTESALHNKKINIQMQN